MFGIGWSEFVLIALVLLIFVGPKHLPSVLKKTGMVIGELKRAGRELQHQVSEEVRDIERSVGDIKSPSALLRDLGDGIGDDIKDPYREIPETKEAVRREVDSIRDEIRSAGQSYSEPAAGDDVDDSAEKSDAEGKDKTPGLSE